MSQWQNQLIFQAEIGDSNQWGRPRGSDHRRWLSSTITRPQCPRPAGARPRVPTRVYSQIWAVSRAGPYLCISPYQEIQNLVSGVQQIQRGSSNCFSRPNSCGWPHTVIWGTMISKIWMKSFEVFYKPGKKWKLFWKECLLIIWSQNHAVSIKADDRNKRKKRVVASGARH